MANSWQQPIDAEPGGGQWHKFEDPGTGGFASKTDVWTMDSFSAGLEVDFSSVVPVGTRAVRVFVNKGIIGAAVWYRKSGDSNVSNTPGASVENSHLIINSSEVTDGAQVILWLSSDYKVQFTVSAATVDLSIYYPVEYLL